MVILASASPRRKELLALILKDFEVIPAAGEENADASLPPAEYVKALASAKAREVFSAHPGRKVIGADTVVCLDGAILGKPKDEADAKAMLKALSGRTHSVFTGVCIIENGTENVFAEETRVTFFELSEADIDAYVSTGDPLDKAGAYGIQDKGALLVSGIEGDYYNVMGLPAGRLARYLAGKNGDVFSIEL